MKGSGMTEKQQQFIALNKRFIAEVEKGTSWHELRWLLEEMKGLAKHSDEADIATPENNLREAGSPATEVAG